MTDTAPYTDPDGHPSWQPNPAVREMDAWSRRHREALAAAEKASRLAIASEQITKHLGVVASEAWDAVETLLRERADVVDLDDDNPNRPYRPEV